MGPESKTKPVIGLVGGVCSGKSTAAAELAAAGCAVIDADRVGHQVLAEPAVRDALSRRWGAAVVTPAGEVDRAAMARIVFADTDELAALTAITWPRIRAHLERFIAETRTKNDVPAVVLDAAVLFEAGWDDICTHVLFVAAPEADRRRRAAAKGWGEIAWRRREKSQFPLDIKAARCYAALDNSSTVVHLREQTRQALHRIVQQADGS